MLKDMWSYIRGTVAITSLALVGISPNEINGQQRPSGFRFDAPKVHFSIQIGADQTKAANEICLLYTSPSPRD